MPDDQHAFRPNRRTVLRGAGSAGLFAAASVSTAGVAVASEPDGHGGRRADRRPDWSIRALGHTRLSDPPGGFAEAAVRDDGRYAVVGSYLGPGGSFLVDLRNPWEPTQVHHVPSPSEGTRHADVKFDGREGLYYRTLEGENTGVDVIDYGFDAGTPEAPERVAHLDAGPTHNVAAHPEARILYSVNEHNGTPGLEVWDVGDPADPARLGSAGPVGGLHDVVVDPARGLAHGAYISDAFDDFDPSRDFAGYLLWDLSDPADPAEAGRFDYASRPDYTEERLANGEPGFANCHYANYDPDRGIAVVGDEIGTGVPGGKHVFDIGWGDGSPADPTHVGFTYSPNAELMDESGEAFDWTGHNFDLVRRGRSTLIVSGDYHEGAVLYDVTDPSDPTPTDRYATDREADEANPPLFPVGGAPMAWGVDHADRRGFAVASDMVTGLYVLALVPERGGERDPGDG